ncbi:nitroreductase family protein [Psychrobacter sp. ANT_H56B]|uniref:nitroreductase family protein n=1 Tax=unclassified Psychrobacter TaxID=196806 RepID=UPI0011EBD9ED|nr:MULTISPECIES: nitroreductase family protein [unclassified Psychrobacter]KAA0929433.1 nitroreductase family protein [Psychrobacter sp. ANT_H56B]KAA0934811.1 nitroreductase family protein [Psychrobacter sp. ANT_H59]MBA2057382.1 nitroreductase family protein [Psychrobacter sp. D2]
MSDLNTLQQLAEKRRSIYALSNQLPVSNDEVVKLVEHAILHTPSSFNSQSTRVVVLFGEEHQKLWNITEETLHAIVGDEEKFKSTKDKIAGFKAGAGTIMFFEDQSVVKSMQENAPLYADKFPIWAHQTNAMHQYVIWTALASIDVGANLQHYNPIIDDKVAEAWNIDKDWTLNAQMVFGAIEQPAGDKTFKPVEERMKVFG